MEIIEIKEIVKLNNGMKFCWGINSKIRKKKDFQNSEMMFCKLFYSEGRHVWSHLVSFRQMSSRAT